MRGKVALGFYLKRYKIVSFEMLQRDSGSLEQMVVEGCTVGGLYIQDDYESTRVFFRAPKRWVRQATPALEQSFQTQ